jgi:hypothetical protein
MQTRTYWKNQNLTFRDEIFGPAEGVSLWQTCPLAALLDPSIATVFYDEFWQQRSTKSAAADQWAIVEDDGAGGTDAMQDAANGIYKHYCDGDNDDEAYLISCNESWLIAAGKSLWFEARVAFTEGSTNAMNAGLGLSDKAAANMLTDSGGGPAAEYDGFSFWKTEGALALSFETSNATTQSTATSLGNHTSAAFANYGCWVRTESASDTVAVCTPYLNGVAYTARNITLSGLEEMHFWVGVKSDGSAEEAFSIDYAKIVQIR